MILPGISWPSFKRTGWERCCRDKPVQDLPPTPRWHLTFQDSPGMTGKGVEEFCRQWGLDVPKEPEKIQGKPVGRKKRERGR